MSPVPRGKPYVIPQHRLPPDFASGIDQPPDEVAEAKPASTVVLVRDDETGLEVLLMRRLRTAGFVPGAWVFPGGRVDAGDAQEVYWAGGSPDVSPPWPFWVAAIREVFEETGVLLARRHEDARFDPRVEAEALRRWRAELLEDRVTLFDVIDDLGLRLDLGELTHLAHWVTPLVEPRRYDTHFFLAALPEMASVSVDAREMAEAQWLSPGVALRHFERGDLPMVFPTVRVLEALAPFSSVQDSIHALRDKVVPTIMPRLVRVKDGIAFLIDEEGSE